MTKEAWWLCSLIITLFVVVVIIQILTRKWAKRSDHHLKRWVENAKTKEYAEAHAQDFKDSNRNFRKVLAVGLGVVALVAAIYVLVLFLTI